ncbi:MAG: phosphoribosyltransferase [Gammaproteobacteria bacterium]|nr:phosphoribosyltransferase [Gammaproteobacteria bacterium]
MSSLPHVFHNLLRYDTLTFNVGVAAAFTVGYRLEDRPGDPWSARFTKSKFDPDEASTRGAVRLMAHAAQIVVRALGLEPEQTGFTPALRSEETSANPDGVLALRASQCAGVCRYYPDLLQKEPHLPTGRGGLYPEFRSLLVQDANYRADSINVKTIFIVDDFVATGKTLSLAATAILERNPNITVYGLALAKPEWHSLMLDWYDVDVNNDHIPLSWASMWPTLT